MAGCLFFLHSSHAMAQAAPNDLSSSRPNVLFIAIDDLRNRLGCLGDDFAKTPNLDRLASSGRLFARHYVQVPTCGASRCALLRGRYPELASHVSNGAIIATGRDWAGSSLPGWFKKHGYQTFALGKITHHPGGRTGKLWEDGPEELPGVWTRSRLPESPWGASQHMMHGYANGVARKPGVSPPWEAHDGGDEAYPDAWVADEAVATLKELSQKKSKEPWFFAVGFFKPHLPFAAPKRWFDLHDPDSIPEPAVTQRPGGVSSWHNSGEFRGNYGHGGRNPENDPEYGRLMRHAYAAATSYMDHQVGRVLRSLDSLGMLENTVVVVWSDHGFLLGEHAIWGKHCLYEDALRAPLIIRHPGLVRPGEVSEAIVETVDVFPTLVDLCGLPVPDGLHGKSLRKQLDEPDAVSGKRAYGFWGRDQRTVRDERWRLIVHEGRGKGEGQSAMELYDYQTDPNEAINVADEHPELVEKLLLGFKEVPGPSERLNR